LAVTAFPSRDVGAGECLLILAVVPQTKRTFDVDITMRDVLYFGAGLGFLGLAKIKHSIQGYRTPKPFALSEVDKCIEYDQRVAANYIRNLAAYDSTVAGKKILELGPGSDVGVGICLLAAGARHYTAFDRFPLARAVPREFYDRFEKRLGRSGSMDHIDYKYRGDFKLSAALPDQSVDVVVSNAAFEHFVDVPEIARQLFRVVRPGGVLCAEIDLRTHSRWIRDKDPNNIYRYPDWLYRLFRFGGIPNRQRPRDYRRALEAAGWTRIVMAPAMSLPLSAPKTVRRKFADEWLNCGSITLQATRA
jgi:SAM-dependent methyltransferase